MTDNWTPNKRSHQSKRKPIKIDLTPIIDAGREYYKESPDMMLISVARKAAALYASKEDEIAFLMGYQQARMQHEDYKNDSSQES